MLKFEYAISPMTFAVKRASKQWIAPVLAGLMVAACGSDTVAPTQTQSAEQKSPITLGSAATISSAELMSGASLSRVSGKLKRRETLSGLLDRLQLNRRDWANAVAALESNDLLDTRKLRPGLRAVAHVEGDKLVSLTLASDRMSRVMAKRNHAGEFQTHELTTKRLKRTEHFQGEIAASLYVDALALGARDQQIADFAQIFAYDLDFQREIHPGDTFEIVAETYTDDRGEYLGTGEVLFASLEGRAVTKAFYRFKLPDTGETDYFQADGESSTRFLMKTPINGARLSSSFGRRRHPISGYTRLHKGTDFAAPTGTPVFAAGHGTVERASRYGGYGKYVRIRHAKGYKTAYAHLSRYGRGVKSGRKVRQGQVIGYVGSTGASTGPHLHYEVYRSGKAVNAMRLKLPTGRKLAETPEIFEAFQARRETIDGLRQSTPETAPRVLKSDG